MSDVDTVKRCECCGVELARHELDQNHLLNTPALFCPRCYWNKDQIIGNTITIGRKTK